MKIIIGGDICPMGSIEPAFVNGNKRMIFNDLLPVIQLADFTVVNLECPLIKEDSPIEKDGPVLGAPVFCINGIKEAGINAVNLANNHILDHGEKGMRSTINILTQQGIEWFGGGKNLYDAGRILIKSIKGKRIGFLGIAEQEFSIAGINSYGANPIDLINIVRIIRNNRNNIDHLIVLVHAGKEYFHFPTPNLQKTCRFLIEEGADVVVCQHSHCAGTFEYYQDKLIVYGQGNFLFEPLGEKNISWFEGFLISLEFNKNSMRATFIPYFQSKGFLGVRRMKVEQETLFLNTIIERSQEITNVEFIEQTWRELCEKEKYLYSSRLRGHNRWLRFLNKKIHFTDWFYFKKSEMIVRNVVECETHREGLSTLWRYNK